MKERRWDTERRLKETEEEEESINDERKKDGGIKNERKQMEECRVRERSDRNEERQT